MIVTVVEQAAGLLRKTYIRRSLVLVSLILVASPARAQSIDPPVTRPLDFSDLVGAYRIQSTANRSEVHVEQPVLLKVMIQGKGPEKYHPRLEKLNIFPTDAPEQFFIEPMPDLTRALPDKDVWEFTFRLRPKSTDVTHLPGLKLVMYNPARRKFQPSYADAIPLTVIPALEPDIKLDLKVVQAPDSFYEIRPLTHPSHWREYLTAGVLFGMPIACLAWYLAWRRRHPDGENVRARRRSLAARTALGRLQTAKQAAEVSAAVAVYLRDRLDFPAHEATAPEVRRFLLRWGVSRQCAQQWSAFLADCDAARFEGRKPPLAERLSHEAMTLIQALEDHSCSSV